MGYYTDFSMEIYDSDGQCVIGTIHSERDIHDIVMYPEQHRTDVVEALRYIKEHSDEYYGLLGEERCTWYDHQDEMKKVSNNYPDLVFILHGEGEEQGDIWTAYFCNGKCEKILPELKWPHFDMIKFARKE